MDRMNVSDKGGVRWGRRETERRTRTKEEGDHASAARIDWLNGEPIGGGWILLHNQASRWIFLWGCRLFRRV